MLTSSMPLSAVVTAALPLSCCSMWGRITSIVAWGAMKINLCTCGVALEGACVARWGVGVYGVWGVGWGLGVVVLLGIRGPTPANLKSLHRHHCCQYPASTPSLNTHQHHTVAPEPFTTQGCASASACAGCCTSYHGRSVLPGPVSM